MAASPRYSDRERYAMYSLMEQGKSAAEAREILNDGYGELGPINPPESTIRRIHSQVLAARTAAELPDDASTAVRTLVKRATGIATAEVDRLERQLGAGRKVAGDLGPAITALDRLEKLTRRMASDAPAQPGESAGDDAEPEQSAFLSDLDDDAPIGDKRASAGNGSAPARTQSPPTH